ncbi:AAA family ATPase [Ideonella azotifigens]|uniref:YhaN AAA domain-containing protein n=2 Tax=Ideonella azotifigens TaxID=513160 RepID=A0ABN1K299_9BURK|nr:YhaN family protein [Ideonella azotifigens]MCD2343794.1 AAA family ATPase [Ideonella azotifigens]
MKLRTLFLNAFGPFTATTLDFSGPASLHLLYGPNEAGKSSALRAMGDLRYGIPRLSTDDFVHAHRDMQLAGAFEDSAGQVHTLARRKGLKDTLTPADPATGAALPVAPLSAALQQALTGSVSREVFETMHGLDSARLRKGGEQLIQGKGELGAALFEASTGTAGIQALLATLQADAKQFFSPRSQTAQLNEATRQLDDARRRYKDALTKPDQWKALKRAHDEAGQQLAQVRQQLAQARHRQAELAELRAVAPLLRELDAAQATWDVVAEHRALPETAREQRLAAAQQQAQASAALDEAEETLAAHQQALDALALAPALLAQAASVDRLDADWGAVRRERAQRVQLAAVAEGEAAQLALQASRLLAPQPFDGALDAFFSRLPSAADQAFWQQALDDAQAAAVELQQLRRQRDQAAERLALLQQADDPLPAAAPRQALAAALQRALALGDTDNRAMALTQAAEAAQRALQRALAELDLPDAASLLASRPLPGTEVDAAEAESQALRDQLAVNKATQERVQADLAVQQRRLRGLAAAGELVTAETLRQARAAREADWLAVRNAFIDVAETRPADPAGLPAQFERSQADADRQADLLRAGAQRAAEAAECESRIAEMGEALAQQARLAGELGERQARCSSRWAERLAALALPGLAPAALREWLGQRGAALDAHERWLAAQQQASAFAQQVELASAALAQALAAIEPDHAPATALPALLAQAGACQQALQVRQTAAEHRQQAVTALQAELQRAQAAEAGWAERQARAQLVLDAATRRLHLPDGAPPAAVHARLAELRDWALQYQRHQDHQAQLRQGEATEAAVRAQLTALGEALEEPASDTRGDALDSWWDGLNRRLDEARSAARSQATLLQQKETESRRKARAEQALEAALSQLAQLLAQAGVATEAELPDAEARAMQRREAEARLMSLQAQLARASQRDAATLRLALADGDAVALDVEREELAATIERQEAAEATAINTEHAARTALAAVDTSDEAARAREEMEAALARYRAGVRPWAQLKLAEALLADALRRHREKAQGPVVKLAGDYLRLMTGGRFTRLQVDAEAEPPALRLQPEGGQPIAVTGLSEGTADQLYLALRLAALELQRTPERQMPLVLDDVLMTADDQRAACMLQALARFAAGGQVLVFTHHRHLLEIAAQALPAGSFKVHQLLPAFAQG